jgi:hypothetical protein
MCEDFGFDVHQPRRTGLDTVEPTTRVSPSQVLGWAEAVAFMLTGAWHIDPRAKKAQRRDDDSIFP